MSSESGTDHWREVEAGFRGSVMLHLGALVVAVGGLVNLGTQLLAGPGAPAPAAVIVAWLLFILGLWLLAAGFSWVGSHPFLSRFGFVVGALHAAQGVYLLILLFTFTAPAIPPVSLTVGRLLATMIFALIEREWLPRRTRRLLLVAAGLQLVKAVARAVGFLPPLGTPWEPLLDSILLLLLAAALFQTAAAVRQQENAWALAVYGTGPANLVEFNNPEHSWNKNVPPGENEARSRRRKP